jgi:hypothetical protein
VGAGRRAAGCSKDLVPDLEAKDIFADRFDLSGEVNPQDLDPWPEQTNHEQAHRKLERLRHKGRIAHVTVGACHRGRVYPD